MTDQSIDNTDALSEIKQRLAVHLDQPDGVIYERQHRKHRILIRKRGSEIALFFAHPSASVMSGIMSEIDLTDPLKLIFGYTRAFMLTLAWCENPKRVYMLGFAGGRVPMVLHYHFPEVIVESTEIDPDVLEIAQSHFGIQFDERQQVALMDGRAYLEAQTGKHYDIVLIDAFLGLGYKPYHLATVEFYDAIKSKLAPDGVVALNLSSVDALYRERLNTFIAAFRYVHLLNYDTAKVLFGSNHEPLTRQQIVARTRQLVEKHRFAIPLLEYAEQLLEQPEIDEHLALFSRTTQVLRDGALPAAIKNLAANDAIFYNAAPDDACPCGSGKTFAQCHGNRTD